MQLVNLKVYDEVPVDIKLVVKALKAYASLRYAIGDYDVLIIDDPGRGYEVTLKGDGFNLITVSKRINRDSHLVRVAGKTYSDPVTQSGLRMWLIDLLKSELDATGN